MPVLSIAARVLAACLVFGALVACGSDETPRPAGAASDGLLDGGPEAFKARLKRLEGTPVVVNQWASWCGPCRFEFPFFGSQAKRLEGKVVFLGVDSRDARNDARDFLRRHPVPFDQFYDHDASIARVFRGGRSWPTTAFYDAKGELVFTHQGAYPTEAALAEDIERYALGG